MPEYILQTERTYFDVISIQYAPNLLAAINSQELQHTHFINENIKGMDKFEDKKLFTQDDVEQIVEFWSNATKIHIYGIFKKETRELIGHFEYDYGWDTHHLFVNLIIYPLYQKNGYGRETASRILDLIFDDTVAHNVSVFFDDTNERGMKFVKNMGFQSSGVITRNQYSEGRFRSLHSYDILRREWRKENAN